MERITGLEVIGSGHRKCIEFFLEKMRLLKSFYNASGVIELSTELLGISGLKHFLFSSASPTY